MKLLKNRMFLQITLLFLNLNFATAQSIIAKKGSYGVDTTHKIIVWHESNLESVTNDFGSIVEITFDKTFKVINANLKLSYTEANRVSYNSEEYKLYITKLPLVHLSLDTTTLNKNKRLPGNFTYFRKDELIESAMGVRQRGNLSLSFPKKSYDLKFKQDTDSKKTRDVRFKGLRSDDDWVLDGLYNEPLKLRSTVATKLWLDFHIPYYRDKEPKAVNGFDVAYVELFRNNEYLGLYALSEQVDRKQLKLKKNEVNTIKGELFKANSYEGGPAFEKAGAYNNLFPHYVGFEMQFPVIEYKSYWNNLSSLLDLVVNQPDDVFVKAIDKNIDIPNTIDYFILVNLIRATDNLGKNYYLAKYDAGEPYFFVPWDLDGSFGVIMEGKRINTTTDILSNNLHKRLIALNPDNFKDKLKTRWRTLRETELSDEKIFKRFKKSYNRFTIEKVYEREQLIWPKSTSNEDDYEYLNKWITNRLIFLDGYFDKL